MNDLKGMEGKKAFVDIVERVKEVTTCSKCGKEISICDFCASLLKNDKNSKIRCMSNGEHWEEKCYISERNMP